MARVRDRGGCPYLQFASSLSCIEMSELRGRALHMKKRSVFFSTPELFCSRKATTPSNWTLIMSESREKLETEQARDKPSGRGDVEKQARSSIAHCRAAT